MAVYRQIHISIWTDDWFLELEPDAKLFFVYLFSNERTCIAGLYDIGLRVMEFETALSRERILELFEQFSKDGKAYYEDGCVWIPNMPIYNTNNIKSIKVQINIKNTFLNARNIPLLGRAVSYYNDMVATRYGIDTVYIPFLQIRSDQITPEQITNGETPSANADPPDTLPESPEPQNETPTTFQEWHTTVKDSKNRPAVLRKMCETLYPGLDPPAYGYLGKVAKKVGGAGRLADLLWQHSSRPPTGDLLSYIQKVAKGNGNNGHNRGSAGAPAPGSDSLAEIQRKLAEAFKEGQ